MKNAKNIFISLILSGAILWLFHVSTVNWHYHYTSNGLLVSHAHLFNKIPYKSSSNSPIQNHKHTEFEFNFLAQLSFLSVIFFVIAKILKKFLFIIRDVLYRHIFLIKINPLLQGISFRGPPQKF